MTQLAIILALTITALSSAATAKTTVHLVEAHDSPFAAVVTVAAGTAAPVLLFDAQDVEPVRSTATLLGGSRACVVRAGREATTAATLMAEVAGAPCKVFDSARALAQDRWNEPERVVAYRIGDEAARVRATGFAAATGAALLPLEPGTSLTADTLAPWEPAALYAASSELTQAEGSLAALGLTTADEVIAAYRDHAGSAPITLLLTNPADLEGIFSPSGLSMVAASYAALHRSPALPVPSADPDEIESFARGLMERTDFVPERILLLGDELAMRSHRIPDPVLAAGGPEARGGGTIIRAEIFSEIHHERPQAFPVGRVVAENLVTASISLARRLHVTTKTPDRPVIFLTNADEIFPLGETISRTTVGDLRNLGVRVRAYFREEITPEVSQQALGQTDVLVWEGHPRDLTLEERGGIAVDTAPKVTVLQGCYTLDRNDPMILIEKGTQAIVATSAAIYSAPGSGFARALFDSIAYDGADLGTAVRNARNYLLALALLRRELGFEEWHKTYRAALAFALWGDPSYRAPMRTGRPDVRTATWKLDDEALTLDVPQRRLREVAVGEYRAAAVPRVMYGGLVFDEGKTRRLRDMFSLVQTVEPGRTHVCAPGEHWGVVSLYAEATRTLTVLARPDWQELGLTKRSGNFRFPLAENAEACAAPSEPTPDTVPAEG